MLKVVQVKTLYDNKVRWYRLDHDIELYKEMFLVANTYLGVDLVSLRCPKVQELSYDDWVQLTGVKDKEDAKKRDLSYEPLILRKAEKSDMETHQKNICLAEEHQSIFQTEIKKHNLDLKIVKLYYTLSKDKLICVYTAPKRIDFRDFVKVMGSHLKQRIELFQISIKDALSFNSYMGCCGRMLCCNVLDYALPSCMLRNESVKYAKNPKNLGCCGKVKCCFYYEEIYDK